MKVTNIKVKDRTYPADSGILGDKQIGLDRGHANAWVLSVDSHTKKYIDQPVSVLKKVLNKKGSITLEELQDSLGKRIDDDARKEILFYQAKKSNNTAGQKVKNARKDYLTLKNARTYNGVSKIKIGKKGKRTPLYKQVKSAYYKSSFEKVLLSDLSLDSSGKITKAEKSIIAKHIAAKISGKHKDKRILKDLNRQIKERAKLKFEEAYDSDPEN